MRTNFRMPDVFSIGLGGGSLVVDDDSGAVTVGPRSVGYRLTQAALVFGGDILTTTDIAVAAAGSRSAIRRRAASRARADRRDARDHRAHAGDGGGTLAADAGAAARRRGRRRQHPGRMTGSVRSRVKPPHFAVANAVGAAIAQVSGEIDRIYSLGTTARATALDDAKQEATQAAVAAGARADSVAIVDVEDVPLAYLPGNATRIRVKAVGELDIQTRRGSVP